MDILNVFVTIVSLSIAVYFLSKKVDTLKGQVEAQQGILNSLKTFKDILNPKDFEDLLKLKLDKQKELLEKEANRKIQVLITQNFNQTRQLFDEKTGGLTESQNELSSRVSAIIMSHFPNYASKSERDIFIKENFPKSQQFLTELIDYYQTNPDLNN